jgi:hypothetical protein
MVTAIELEVIEDDDGTGPGRADNGNFVINELEIRTQSGSDPLSIAQVEATFEQDLYPIAAAIDGNTESDNGWAISPAMDRSHLAIFVLEEPVIFPAPGVLVITIHQLHGTSHLIHALSIKTTDDPSPHLPPPDDIAAVLAKSEESRTGDDDTLLAHHVLARSNQLSDLRDQIQETRSQHNTHAATIPTTLVMETLADDHQRTTYLFRGGSFLAPDHDRGPLFPAVPSWLHDWPQDAPSDRQGLAMWLTDDANPLTARVQVNRAWEQLFGRGLVSTLDDFGIQGTRPTHPGLLDDLAVRFQDEFQWSQKTLLKYLMQTATYRQSSIASPKATQHDPENTLLSHANRIRLTAEQVRDAALATSGLLVTDRVGGPSVMPYLPDGRLPQAFSGFVEAESTGDDLHRRGLYTSWRRTGHHPIMATFDAPSREVCTIVRERSNTPLQALALLNDDIFIEAAQALARVAMEDPNAQSTSDRIALAFLHAIGRPPTDQERDLLLAIHDEARRTFERDLEHAEAMATEPLGPWPESIPLEDAAAMVIVGNVLYNLDEFVTRP